jgi:large subunit ribosomal protein L13
MSTPSIKKGEIERRWLLVDAEGKTLGRLASQVAAVLKGKHRPQYTPHADAGDFVVVINAEKIRLTGRKLAQKKYYKHTGYPGGLKEASAGELLEKRPEDLVVHAVRRMLPRSPLGRKLMKKLHVYAGPDHNQVAQKPEPFELPY